MAKHIVTFAPPTPNGGLHLGHLAGPYMAADIYARAFRSLGDEVLFVSYSDDYQSYLARKAKEEGVDEDSLSAKNHAEISQALRLCDIAPDRFIRSLNVKDFQDSVDFFYRGVASGLVIKDDEVPYCPDCEQFGFEAHARGTCHHCGELTDRSQCENCASAPEITGASGFSCHACGEAMTMKKVSREYLNLNEYRDEIKALACRDGVRAPLTSLLERYLDSQSLLWPIDRPNEHGAPCTQAKNGILSTWFSGIAGYHAASQSTGKLSLWQDEETHCAFFVGFDCSFSHAAVYPSLMKAAGFPCHDKVRVYTNAFLKLDGLDFSTSRGIAIWANDLLQAVDADYVRFYLSLVSPETDTANFKPEEFCTFANERFYGPLKQWFENAEGMTLPGGITSVTANGWRDTWRTMMTVGRFSVRALAEWLLSVMGLAVDDHQAEANVLLVVFAALAYSVIPAFSLRVLDAAGLTLEDCQPWLSGETDSLPPMSGTLDKSLLPLPMALMAADLKGLMRGVNDDETRK